MTGYSYNSATDERLVYAVNILPGQQVFLFGEFRTVKRVERPDYRRTFNVTITDTTGKTWPVGADKTITVRDE